MVLGNMETRKQFIITIRILILVESKVVLQTFIKTLVFQAHYAAILVAISKI